MSTVLPDMHYITERDRAQIHPAVVRSISIPSIPSGFPFKAPISKQHRTRGPRFTIGWLEFQSPEQPDPEVARPGDVWIQLPSGHRKARVYACYKTEGKDWSPWSGNSVSLGRRGNTPMHPYLNDHAQCKFYLVFNGSEFTWSNPKAVSVIMHSYPQIYTMGPAEAVIKWLKVTGVGRTSPVPVQREREKAVRSTSAPLDNSRKRTRAELTETRTDTASAPPAKKPKHSSSHQPESSPEQPLSVKVGAYAKAGATQQGWIMSIDGMPLHMPFPCINCTRAKTPCSGIPGERCGRCRFKRLGCSHHAQKARAHSAAPAITATEAPTATTTAPAPATATVNPPPTSSPQSGLTLRVPRLRPVNNWVSESAVEPTVANKKRAPRRVRIRSASISTFPSSLPEHSILLTHDLSSVHSDNEDIRSSSPLSSVLDHRARVDSTMPPHSESAMLDARDDAAVENLLDSASVAVSAAVVPPASDAAAASVSASASASAPDAEGTGAGAGEPPAQNGAAVDETPAVPDEAAGGEEGENEDEEFARFVQMTFDGIARWQEGLRGVFELTRRNLKDKRIAAAAAQMVVAGSAAAGVPGVQGGGEGASVSATQ